MARKTLLQLLDELAPGVQAAFLASVRNIRSDFQMRAFEDAYRAGDIEGALRILHLDAAYFAPLDDALRAAYLAGGAFAFEEVRAITARVSGFNTVVGRFGATNPAAVEQLARFSSARIVEISDDTRAMVRTLLADAMQTDTSPSSGPSACRVRPARNGAAGRSDRSGQQPGGVCCQRPCATVERRSGADA